MRWYDRGRGGGYVLVDEVGLFGVVEMDFVGLGLPVGGEDYHCFGLDLLGYFLADGLEDWVDGVFDFVLNVGLGELVVGCD